MNNSSYQFSQNVSLNQQRSQKNQKQCIDEFLNLIDANIQNYNWQTLTSAQQKNKMIRKKQELLSKLNQLQNNQKADQNGSQQNYSSQWQKLSIDQIKKQISQVQRAIQTFKKNQQNSLKAVWINKKILHNVQHKLLKDKLFQQKRLLIMLEEQRQALKLKERLQSEEQLKKLQYQNLTLFRTYIANLDKQIAINSYLSAQNQIKEYIEQQQNIFNLKKAPQGIQQKVYLKQKEKLYDPIYNKIQETFRAKRQQFESLNKEKQRLQLLIKNNQTQNHQIDERLKKNYQQVCKLVLQSCQYQQRYDALINLLPNDSNQNSQIKDCTPLNPSQISNKNSQSYIMDGNKDSRRVTFNDKKQQSNQQNSSSQVISSQNGSEVEKNKKQPVYLCQIKSNLKQQILSRKVPLVILSLLTLILFYYPAASI